ncbi:Ig-like domain-containing protein [Litoribacter ruber]|uniref:glucoamylase family protein n=1 Tax=Litoribacter ruber TaxID=702568 RepID=UPI001BD9F33D|nr:glucoamylase family protein [Litoribacter ruber]MBT0812411.1 Ig-like domain-containing protein [Litoribacter ruber]
MKTYLPYFLLLLIIACNQIEPDIAALQLLNASVGDDEISLSEPISENLPLDRPITLDFSQPLDPASISAGIALVGTEDPININTNLVNQNRTVIIYASGALRNNTVYRIQITDQLKGAGGNAFSATNVSFKTQIGDLTLQSFTIENSEELRSGRIVNVPLEPQFTLNFSHPINRESIQQAVRLSSSSGPDLNFAFEENDTKVIITSTGSLEYLARYEISVSEALQGAEGESFAGTSRTFFTQVDETPKFPLIPDEELLTKVQEHTFRYFWDFAHENSGLARERNTSGNLVTIGGSGFGVMAIIVGVERNFITRNEAVERWEKIVDFLDAADRFYGVWPHWLNGNDGSVIPFSTSDNGGDLVETAFMIQGLLTVQAYLDESQPRERAISEKITQLWREVEWDWYTRGGQDVLFWHYSPDQQWAMNLPIQGYNECLITYVLAAASPTHSIEKSVYDNGWARSGNMVNGGAFYDIPLPLGEDYGGPMFFSHYSFLGLDPRNLQDQYANYWEQSVNHTLINRAYCIDNPSGFVGYGENSWGLTASDNHLGYSAHSPRNDLGVITPTAALSSFPYTPEESMEALKFFYYTLGDRLWGEYGFHDAFNPTEEWYADSYLAIDQGPILLMIENHRTGLLWDLFMQNNEVRNGLNKLQFNY